MTEPTRTIVIADEAASAAGTKRVLEAAGFRVVTTRDVQAAAAVAAAEGAVLVLSEIFPGNGSGYGLVQALRSDPRTIGTPVAFLTGHRDFNERVKAFRSGVADYITKPVDESVLLRKVGKLVASKERRPPEKAAPSGVLPDRAPAMPYAPSTRPPEVSTLPGSAQGAAPPSQNQRVLIVDDHRELRTFLAQVLKANGFVVDEAEDGGAALERMASTLPALVLTDVIMPEMDGFELCRRIRENPALRRVPIVFLSGADAWEERSRAFALGADEFLSKQTPARELVMRLRLLLDQAGAAESRLRGAGLAGRIESVGASGALQFCHWGRLSGELRATGDQGVASFRFRRGEVVDVRVGALVGQDALVEFLSWEAGSFEFLLGDPGPAQPLADSFSHFLIEGTRLLDERRRARLSES